MTGDQTKGVSSHIRRPMIKGTEACISSHHGSVNFSYPARRQPNGRLAANANTIIINVGISYVLKPQRHFGAKLNGAAFLDKRVAHRLEVKRLIVGVD